VEKSAEFHGKALIFVWQQAFSYDKEFSTATQVRHFQRKFHKKAFTEQEKTGFAPKIGR
jgi:hypothetical protein